jgi:hypothetical protein
MGAAVSKEKNVKRGGRRRLFSSVNIRKFSPKVFGFTNFCLALEERNE